jgi:hypothetical protein
MTGSAPTGVVDLSWQPAAFPSSRGCPASNPHVPLIPFVTSTVRPNTGEMFVALCSPMFSTISYRTTDPHAKFICVLP